jgi:sulfonate transport system ATP-binding protein
MATRSVNDALGSDRGVDDVAVQVRNVARRFGDREVLRGIDLDIRPGEFVALLGRSGSGKSTFLRALAALDPGVTGEILVPERRAVGFQDPRLLPWARVLDNVVLGLGGRSKAQRAALARALVREPALLLLDEPFGALDALTRIRMHRLVAELCARHHPAVLLVTHDVDEAIVLADRVLVLTDGVISLDRSIDSTFPRPRSRSDARFAALRSDLLAELGVEDDATLDLSGLDPSDLDRFDLPDPEPQETP